MALYLNGRDGLLFKTQACNDGNDDLIAHSKKNYYNCGGWKTFPLKEDKNETGCLENFSGRYFIIEE